MPKNNGATTYIYLFAGWGLLFAGLVITPLPIPIGILIVVLGITVLIRNSTSVRRFIRKRRSNNPGFSNWLSQIAIKAPPNLAAIIESTRPDNR